jgi:hypothetical protein
LKGSEATFLQTLQRNIDRVYAGPTSVRAAAIIGGGSSRDDGSWTVAWRHLGVLKCARRETQR